MIAASEPLEFIPWGRQAVEEHPGPEVNKQHPSISSENVLLNRMQNVNISSPEEHNEFWCVREIFEDTNEHKQIRLPLNHATSPKYGVKQNKKTNGSDVNFEHDGGEYMTDFYVNSEEELYVKNYTAVWTKGLGGETSVLPRICFTCESPIKFAFFCNASFVRGKITDSSKDEVKEEITSICLIDSSSLRVYCSNGEDFLANLEFPVSRVFMTRFGLLLEKEASSTIIQSHAISMPRLFSLSHPLEEICPVLNKSITNVISYLIEAEYNIVFSEENTNLVLLFDNKIGKHFVAKLRKATEDEISYVGSQNEIASNTAAALSGTLHQHHHHTSSHRLPGNVNFSQNSMKFSGAAKNSTAYMGRFSVGTSNYTTHISKFLSSVSSAHSLNSQLGNLTRSASQNPMTRLQSTIGQHSMSVQDIRKLGQSQPSKPIVPEYCLEHIWTEVKNGCEFCEVATLAFIHTDLVGQTYLCYLLPRSLKLQLVSLKNYFTDGVQISSKSETIAAKDAVVLKRMNMIAVLDPSGCLILYTGSVVVSKVHVAAVMTAHPAELILPTAKAKSLDASFPRRSSLLPSAQKQADTTFEEELHLLSPVHPLQPQFPSRNTSNVCLNIRDPAGNRLTLVYSNGKMYRISLPLINETKLVSRSLTALRAILSPEQYIQLMIRWYYARNPPGSHDFSSVQEWDIFKCVLSDLMGCTLTSMHDSLVGSNTSFNSEEPKKRRKNDEITAGTDEDWEYMMTVLEPRRSKERSKTASSNVRIDESACLFKIVPAIFYGLHLLYEDFKLDDTMYCYLEFLAEYLYQLATDMSLASFMHHYCLDFPHLLKKDITPNAFNEQHASKMMHKELLEAPAPSIFGQLEKILANLNTMPYEYVDKLNDLSRNVLQVISLILHGMAKIRHWIKLLEFGTSVQAMYPKRAKRFISTTVPRSEQVIQMLLNMNMTRNDIERLPVAIHLIIAESLECSRLRPPVGSSPETYELILRSELVEHARFQTDSDLYTVVKFKKSNIDAEDSLSARCPPSTNGISRIDAALDDGMDNVDTKLLSLRFPDDLRITEVRRLLTSSEPVLIDIPQSPGTSDHEFIEEQEKQLFAMCTRTMTLPMGRGMFTLRTSIPTPTESMPIPKLCLSGKEPEKGATIEMQQIEFPANMSLWPTFHNGVAAGLKISPNARDVDSTWIVYNKPKGPSDISTEHAGFLMALGLNGHLKTLSFMSIYEYLVKCDEMTSVGLLLGISATHRGTMDNTTTKLLSVHIEALLPATALELDIPQNIQVASLMGIGLIYQGTAKRHIAEVLLQEIGRPPGPEMENSIERESYALTAGLALGLVTLGQGESPAGLRDLQLPDTLHYYMVGGNKRLLTGSQKEKYKLPSFQVREGDNVNIDVTAPGATLALGLMFFNTGNRAVSAWMKPPDTSYLLDLVRPDMLLLRTIARGLIQWSDIKPDTDWLFGQFPENLRFDVERGATVTVGDDVDHEAIAQAYCNIIAGAAFCIGLKYAGTENTVAFTALRKAIKQFLAFPGKYVGEYAGKATVESSLILILLSISLVFAGTGDLEILRIIRYLRSRIGAQHTQVTYGSHMGIHMALGFLFMGAGRFTLAKTPEAIAALVCALFPKFPNHSNDNRYHLQAFRHLYVLAIEPRLLLPRDIDTKKLCLCNVSILEVGSKELKRLPTAPCMLPELSTLQKVIVDDPIYWPVSFEKGRNWEQLVKALEVCGCIDIKKRSGCLSHLEDPDRLKSMFAQTLTTEQYTCWKIDIKTLETFSNDPYVIGFTDRFLNEHNTEHATKHELELYQQLILLFYNAVIKDKMHALPIYFSILNAIQKIAVNPTSLNIWQIKLIEVYMQRSGNAHILVSEEIVNSYVFKLKAMIHESCQCFKANLKRYVSTTNLRSANITENLNPQEVAKLFSVIIYYDVQPNVLNLVDLTGTVNYLRYLYEFTKLKLEPLTIHFLINILIENCPHKENVSIIKGKNE